MNRNAENTEYIGVLNNILRPIVFCDHVIGNLIQLGLVIMWGVAGTRLWGRLIKGGGHSNSTLYLFLKKTVIYIKVDSFNLVTKYKPK